MSFYGHPPRGPRVPFPPPGQPRFWGPWPRGPRPFGPPPSFQRTPFPPQGSFGPRRGQMAHDRRPAPAPENPSPLDPESVAPAPIPAEPDFSLKRKSETEPAVASKQPKLSPGEPLLYNQIWAENYGAPLPPELLAKCKPLSCDLCSVTLNSAVQSKMHYEGKTHDRKTRNFLAASLVQQSSGLPNNPPGPTAEAQPASELPAQPAIANPAMHCQLCNVGFNSAVHAKQHYEGKNHAKKLKLSQPPATIPAAMIAVTTVDATPDQYKPTLVGPFVCELCDVSMTSQPQLDAHLQGKPHRTKVERTNKLAAFGEVPNILASPGGKRDNYSIYRTPSGQLYCSFCNISVDSDHQFGQHLESKKHKSKQKSSSSKPIFK